jgi:hypothetical protein
VNPEETLTIDATFRDLEKRSGAPGRTRTCGPLLRRQMLYPLSYGSPYVEAACDVSTPGNAQQKRGVLRNKQAAEYTRRPFPHWKIVVLSFKQRE